jgi:hypothetical protein
MTIRCMPLIGKQLNSKMHIWNLNSFLLGLLDKINGVYFSIILNPNSNKGFALEISS